jgi:hypothetical protein
MIHDARRRALEMRAAILDSMTASELREYVASMQDDPTKRGFVLSDNGVEELPLHMIAAEIIFWPLVLMLEAKPGSLIQYGSGGEYHGSWLTLVPPQNLSMRVFFARRAVYRFHY